MNLNFTLIRDIIQETFTAGHLYLGTSLICDTLELREPKKENDRTRRKEAIHPGTYEIAYNPKAEKKSRKLRIVPDSRKFFSGVYIESGNSTANTKGCILVGQRKKFKKVNRLEPSEQNRLENGSSIPALNKVLKLVEDYYSNSVIMVSTSLVNF